MSRKKRILRAGCITLLLLAFIGYFTFTTLLFSPFESRFNADVAGLIPRDVDLYVARAELRTAFSRFPDLAVAEDLADNTAVKTFLESPEWEEFNRANRVTETLAEVKEQLSQLPLDLDLFDIAGGEDLAIAADFAGRSAADSEWAVYARLSFWGKAAVSMLKFPGVLGLSNQGINAETVDGVITLSGPRLAKPIHITRINDVLIAGVSLRLVQRARELEGAGSEDSLLLAAPYNDSILSVDRDAKHRDFEIQFDLADMRAKWGMTEPWLNPKAQRFGPAFLARLLPLDAVRRVLGVVDFHEGVDIDIAGEFSSEQLTTAQERIHRFKGFDHDEVMDVARYVPDDATVFIYIRGPIGTLLKMVYESMEPAAQANFLDVIRKLDYSVIGDLIDDLDNSLVDRLAFIARPNDWGFESDMEKDLETGETVYMGPPNDGAPVFAWAVIAWISDEAKLVDLREKIAFAGAQIGIQGRDGARGYMHKPIRGGLYVREFWSPFIPGTGHIASLIYDDNLLISNRYALIDSMVSNRVGRGASVPRLSNRGDFQILLQDSLPSANVLAWSNPRSGSELLREQAQNGARNRISSSIDYVTKRVEVERDVLARAFEGRQRARLNADEAKRLDGLVDDQLRAFTDDVIEQNMPRELASVDRSVTYLNAVTSALSLLKLSPRDFQLSVRIVTPYDN